MPPPTPPAAAADAANVEEAGKINDEAPPPLLLLRHYPHVAQASHYDCGIACVRMVLQGLPSALPPPAAGAAAASPSLEAALADSGLATSVWSPDLLFLLLRCGVKARLYSRRLEPDPGYAALSYYKEEFVADQQRLGYTLAWIRAQDPAAAVQEPVSMATIVDHLQRRLGPIVCLIDLSRIRETRLQTCLQCGCCCVGQKQRRASSYQGHYILLCGLSRGGRPAPKPGGRRVASYSHILYRDPAGSTAEPKAVSLRQLDTARRAFGTDEDLIFVYE